MDTRKSKRIRRHKRIRAKVRGSGDRPRLSVFRSLKHIYGQLIDDYSGLTVVAANDFSVNKIKSGKEDKKNTPAVGAKVEIAFKVGKSLAEEAKKKGISRVVFDRGGFAYHGRVKAFAEGARAGGLEF